MAEHARPAPAPELSRPIAVDRIGAARTTVTIEADAAERAALAQRFGIPAVDALSAAIACRRVRGGRFVEVACDLEAQVTQTCVVTLEPVAEEVRDRQVLLFGPLDARPGRGRELDLSPDDDEPEPIEDGAIDLGEVVAQQLSLALEPYPRRADADFERHDG